jgi:hypothetical protein
MKKRNRWLVTWDMEKRRIAGALLGFQLLLLVLAGIAEDRKAASC